MLLNEYLFNLKQRFPILGNLIRIKGIRQNFQNVVACDVFQNIGKHFNEVIDYVQEEENDIENNDPIDIVEENDILLRRRGQQKNNEVMDLLLEMF